MNHLWSGSFLLATLASAACAEVPCPGGQGDCPPLSYCDASRGICIWGIPESGAGPVQFQCSLQAEMVRPSPAVADRFGASVGISGDQIFVSAPNASSSGQDQAGAVYAFSRSESFSQAHQVVRDALYPDTANEGFGTMIAASGAGALIVASMQNKQKGFWLPSGGTIQVLSAPAAMSPPDAAAVPMSGTMGVLASSSSWLAAYSLITPMAVPIACPSSSMITKVIAADAGWIANVYSGTVRMYQYDSMCTQAADLVGMSDAKGVALAGTTLAATTSSFSPAVAVFTRSGSPASWAPGQVSTALPPGTAASAGMMNKGDAKVALNGNLLAVGLPIIGEVWIYRQKSDGSWGAPVALHDPHDNANATTAESASQFGRALAVTPSQVVVGAENAQDDGRTNNIGRAYVYACQ